MDTGEWWTLTGRSPGVHSGDPVESFHWWQARFEIYSLCVGLKASQKARYLPTCLVGPALGTFLRAPPAVKACPDAAMKTLDGAFGSGRGRLLAERLLSCKQQDGETVFGFYSRLSACLLETDMATQQLACAYFLQGLLPSIREGLTVKTWDTVEQLVNQTLVLQAQQPPPSVKEVTLVVATSGGRRCCRRCGEDHLVRNCPALPLQPFTAAHGLCQRCGGAGHKARKCPHSYVRCIQPRRLADSSPAATAEC